MVQSTTKTLEAREHNPKKTSLKAENISRDILTLEYIQ